PDSQDQVSLTVAKAHLTVTADDQRRLVGAADPTFTATITGFQNGESLDTSGVTGSAAFSSDDTPTSPAAAYTITVTQGTLAAATYDSPTFANGTLFVLPPTKTTLASSPRQATFGQVVTLTATVRVTLKPATPLGTVTFMEGQDVLGTADLNSKHAA